MPTAHGTIVKTLKVCPKILVMLTLSYLHLYISYLKCDTVSNECVKSNLTHEIEGCVIHFCIKMLETGYSVITGN